MQIEERLYDLVMAYWDLQKLNYDIERNYQWLLDFDFADPNLDETLNTVITRCREVRDSEKPPPEPGVDAIFRESIAPLPNNSVINVVARAIMAGGQDFAVKPGGWRMQRGNLVYEVTPGKAGTISVDIEECQDQIGFVQSLNTFTLDVLMAILGHLGFTYCENRTDSPLSLRSTVTARQILKYKGITSYGKKRWDLIEKIQEEMDKLNRLVIHVQEGKTMNGLKSYRGHLALMKPVKRDFNLVTQYYVTSSWDIQPGTWVVYFMSQAEYAFIGKLDQGAFKFDHRAQRGVQSFAKKLVYALFTVPGGMYYIKNGAKKSLAEYLQLIGEYREGDDIDRKKGPRTLKCLGKALDVLVDQNLITTNIAGSVHDYIAERCKPWNMRSLLQTRIEIKKSEPE